MDVCFFFFFTTIINGWLLNVGLITSIGLASSPTEIIGVFGVGDSGSGFLGVLFASDFGLEDGN